MSTERGQDVDGRITAHQDFAFARENQNGRGQCGSDVLSNAVAEMFGVPRAEAEVAGCVMKNCELHPAVAETAMSVVKDGVEGLLH